jgi:adenine deaminase
VNGRALNAYAAAGIESDHEAATLEEGRERLRAGLWLLIREASSARNLHALAPLALEYGPSRMAFCTDDREPEHVADDGHINAIVRDAVALGLPPEDAIVMATLNPAAYHGLRHLGAIAPGRRADILFLDDLVSFVPARLLKRGRPVVEIASVAVPDWVRRTVHVGPLDVEQFAIPWRGGRARVIGLVADQIITASLEDELTAVDGLAVADPKRDLAKIAVFERHLQTGRVGLGFVNGFGLERGALGSTVAHDAHNLIVVGADDVSMLTAAKRLRDLGGGLVVADGDQVLA